MTIEVKGTSGNTHLFEGPYSQTDQVKENSGVYLILCLREDGDYDPIDVGESANIKHRLQTHDRLECWRRNCKSELVVAVMYTPNQQQSRRVDLEQDIRSMYIFPCGKR